MMSSRQCRRFLASTRQNNKNLDSLPASDWISYRLHDIMTSIVDSTVGSPDIGGRTSQHLALVISVNFKTSSLHIQSIDAFKTDGTGQTGLAGISKTQMSCCFTLYLGFLDRFRSPLHEQRTRLGLGSSRYAR